MKCGGNQPAMRTIMVRALSFSAVIALTLNPALTPVIAADYRAAAPVAVEGQMNARFLALGIGKSIVIDLPRDIKDVLVADPKIANAVVRSARRLYVAAVANGQTTIFALAADGSKIAAIEVTVGRDIGELQELLNVALPGNDITVKTVADSIILMGSVASAGEAQKALDIASGFVGTSVLGGASNAPQAAPAAGTSMQVSVAPSGTPLTGKVINSLTIRGLDQVSLKVTISEIRRDIIKQLGVNMAGTGSGASGFGFGECGVHHISKSDSAVVVKGAMRRRRSIWRRASRASGSSMARGSPFELGLVEKPCSEVRTSAPSFTCQEMPASGASAPVSAAPVIMPAATVALVAGSMRMKLPVTRFSV